MTTARLNHLEGIEPISLAYGLCVLIPPAETGMLATLSRIGHRC